MDRGQNCMNRVIDTKDGSTNSQVASFRPNMKPGLAEPLPGHLGDVGEGSGQQES